MTVDQALAQLRHTGYLAVRYQHRFAVAHLIGSLIALAFVVVAGLAGLVRLWQITGLSSEPDPAGVAIFAVCAGVLAGLVGLAAWLAALAAGRVNGQHPGLVLTAQGAAVGAPGRRATASVPWPQVTEVRALRIVHRTVVLIMSGKKGKTVPIRLEFEDERLYALVSSAHRMFAPPPR
ncbi:hypothetical protein [Ruania zhangjianzhongii]|uniref:hypothetical protein n=1 Tax=Ruania zhangjianzhongii TaxID=2603206 RepID=UPI0011C88995|nr:hypothetical protein [Ruania zhangjianzhongii]